MLEIYFERKEKYSFSEANVFFEGIDKINKYVLLGSCGFFFILFLIGYVLNNIGVGFPSIFIGGGIMSITYCIQCSKLTETLLANEKHLTETITAETLCSLIKNEKISKNRKISILMLVSRRKLDYMLTMHMDEDVKYFIQKFISENYRV